MEQKLNEKLIWRYAPNLFVAFENNVPLDREMRMTEIECHLKTGYSNINQEREKDNLKPDWWGDKPILPLNTAPFGEAPIAPMPGEAPGVTEEDIANFSETIVREVQKRLNGGATIIDLAPYRKKEMGKDDWIQAWKEDPEWGRSLKPSPLVQYLVKEDRKSNLKGKLLEIGCGNGRDSIAFGKEGYDVIGIDISPEAIKAAKKNNKLKNVKFEVGDAESLKFEDQQFNLIYSLSVLHSTKLSKSIKEVSRVLADGGLGLLFLYIKSVYTDNAGKVEVEVNFRIGELEKIYKSNNLGILDKYKSESKDKVDGETHVHSIIVYLLRKEGESGKKMYLG